MLRIALLTVRARWVAFAGSFIALTLGVALTATMGLALAAAIGTSAEPGSAAEKTLHGTEITLGTAGGICGFVAVFVVASTFALAVAVRQRELALLRMLGATHRQLRRMLIGEAFLVGALASFLGCLLGPVFAPLLGRWLIGRKLAPASYEVPISAWPLALAFGTGLTVSLLGVWATSRRAGRIRPAEALREATLERRAMTIGRWVTGTGAAAAGLAMMASVLGDPDGATNRKHYIPVTMMLIAGVALLAPVVVPPLARLITWPLGMLPGAGSMIVRENVLTAARRTASTAAPVVVTVGLALSLLGVTATIDAAKRAELRAAHRSDLVVVPTGTSGLSQAVFTKVATLPGVDKAAWTPTIAGALTDDEASAGAIDVTLRPGTDRAATLTALRGISRGMGAEALTTADWVARAGRESGRQSRLGMLVVLGVALLYCVIAIASTLVMAAAGRMRDTSVLRMTGATRRQVLRVVAGESLLVVAIGTVLAVPVSLLSIGGVVAGLHGLTGRFTVDVPWTPVGGVVAACAVTALVASVLPVRASMRGSAARPLGMRD